MVKSSGATQAGAACGRAFVPFRGQIREIASGPLRMNSPRKTTPMVEHLLIEGFNMGSLPVVLVAAAHAVRRTRLQDKEAERPCSPFFMPMAFRYQIQKHVSAVWCSAFNGSTVEDFLAVFRASDCIIADLFTHGGRGVQLRSSLRYLEFSYAVCAAMDRGENDGGISSEVGNHYIRAVILMAGWFIHPENMTVKNDQPSGFVQRDALGTAVPEGWQLGLARFLNDGPDSLQLQGSSGSRLSRSQVAPTESTSQHSCLAGSCGHGCGTPNCEDDVCMHCTMLSMVYGGVARRA